MYMIMKNATQPVGAGSDKAKVEARAQAMELNPANKNGSTYDVVLVRTIK